MLRAARAGRTAAVAATAVAVAVGVVARFATTSPLWLDEALSVNIATLPLDQLPDALRQDGHPPLFYVLLHGWVELFGTGDLAVRALSGVISLLGLPLAFLVGRRRAGTAGGLATLGLYSLTPFAVRYATETRMYSLVMVLVLAAWLLSDDLRRTPSRWRWGALALTTGAGLLTHYWVFQLLAGSTIVLGLHWWRGGARERAGALRVATSLVAGAVLFLPWLPVFLAQLASTGTPWAAPGRPTQVADQVIDGLGGGERFAEGPLFGYVVVSFALLGLFGVTADRHRMQLDLTTRPGVRAEMAVTGVTIAVGVVLGYLTRSAFDARYAAVVVPLLLVAAGVGLVRLPAGAPRVVAAGVAAVLALAGIGANVVTARTQAAEVADAIVAAGAPDPLVAACPDQLGPSTERALPDGYDVVGVPTLAEARRIDWRDYAQRNRSADVAAVADDLLGRAGERDLWLVFNAGYETYEGLCERLVDRLGGARPGGGLVLGDEGEEYFESAALFRFPARPPAP